MNLSAYAKQDDLAGAVSSIHALSVALGTVSTGDLNVIENISMPFPFCWRDYNEGRQRQLSSRSCGGQ